MYRDVKDTSIKNLRNTDRQEKNKNAFSKVLFVFRKRQQTPVTATLYMSSP